MNELANMNGSWKTLLDRASEVLKLNLIQFDFRVQTDVRPLAGFNGAEATNFPGFLPMHWLLLLSLQHH